MTHLPTRRDAGSALVALLAAVPVALWAVVTEPVLAATDPVAMEAASADRLKADVVMLVDELGPRHHDQPEKLVAVADRLQARFTELGLTTERQPVPSDVVGAVNVIGRLGPAKGPVVVVGAHYDAYKETPGADDNASGVAGLLELARLLTAHPPPIGVEFVAYANEEPPYFRSQEMGSRVHAASVVDRDLVLMISLECLGTFSDERGTQHFPFVLMRLFYPTRGDFIGVVGKSSQGAVVREVKRAMQAQDGVPVEAIAAPTWIPGIDWSDHLAYWDEGFDAVMITDTALNRNDAYHDPEDTPDRLDYVRMAAVIDGVAQVVWDQAD